MRIDATGLSDPPEKAAARAKRLRFRAWRRGMKETDLVLGAFADRHAAELSAQDTARFESLLDEPDADVYAWIAGRAPPPPRHDHELLARLRAFALAPSPARPEEGS